MSNESQIGKQVWNYCGVLRDDGINSGDYIEQLTYLLFLKMDYERSREPFNEKTLIPEELGWEGLLQKDGSELDEHYQKILTSLGKEKGILGIIFAKAQNKLRDPVKLKRLITLINEETWLGLDVDVKGAIYEDLLQRYAEETKSWAGQYFTPRHLIRAIVEVMAPEPGMTIDDPACGTGGFLLLAHDYISSHYEMDKRQKTKLKYETMYGTELGIEVARLCLMNLYLHGIDGGDEYPVPITVADSLVSDPGKRYDMVLTNPPFGKQSSMTITNGSGKVSKERQSYTRDDFWVTTSNKQLNFLQHVKTLLKVNGRAAVVLPDNVLFEGGAGERVREKLLNDYDVHTLLRLPTGIFYAGGVKTNVLFFDAVKAGGEPHTKGLWIYDFRTGWGFNKTNPMKEEHLQDFIGCFNPKNRNKRKETERFKYFSYEELVKRDKLNLDIFWLKDDSVMSSENLPDADVLVEEMIGGLESALVELKGLAGELEAG